MNDILKPGQTVTVLTVTLTRQYVVPMIDDVFSEINGWTIEQVKRDWFTRYPLNQSHATRDGHQLGNSDQLVSISERTEKLDEVLSDPRPEAIPL